jgi:hypothetical protein
MDSDYWWLTPGEIPVRDRCIKVAYIATAAITSIGWLWLLLMAAEAISGL